MLNRRLGCALAAVAISVSGCSSMHALTTPTGPPDSAWPVRVGDHVRLTTRDGRQHDLTLQSIDSTALVATEGTRYDMREIQSVERRQFSGIKTAILVGGLTAGVLLIIIAAAEAALVGGIQ